MCGAPALKSNSLDKSAQLDNGVRKQKKPPRAKRFHKRYKTARAKWFTRKFVHGLLTVRGSANRNGYFNSLKCAEVMYVNADGHLVSKYCKNRWCLVCNRIRTAQYIDAYKPVISAWSEPRFVTLTVRSPYERDLQDVMAKMQDAFVSCVRSIKYTGAKFEAVRKIECTHNSKAKTYHPHFHVLVNGAEQAGKLSSLWLERCMARGLYAVESAQDVRPVQDSNKSLVEMFKYFTKVLPKKAKNVDFVAQDRIFTAFRGRRVVQNYGLSADATKHLREKKIAELPSDDLDLTAQVESGEYRVGSSFCFDDNLSDWIDYSTGELLTWYVPSKREQRYAFKLDRIIDDLPELSLISRRE